jgi:hypothetical protein
LAINRDLIERVRYGLQVALRQMEISRGVFQVGVAQQKLNRSQVSAGFHQGCSKAVSEDILIVLISLIEQRSAIAITLSTG